jgi:TonB family protein
MIHRPGLERRRTLLSLGAALAIHAVAVAVVTLLAGLGQLQVTEPQGSIDVQLEPPPLTEATAGTPSSVPETVALPSSSSVATGASGVRAAAAVAAGSGSTGGPAARPTDGFVVPTPRVQAAASASPLPSGSTFREAGERTGVAESLPDVQGPAPSIAAGQGGSGTGQGAVTGAAQAQRSGEGVLVTGQGGSGTAGTLDLSQLDKTIAGAGTGGGGTGSGTGSGTAGAGAGQGGAGGTGPGDYTVVWDTPDAARGRELLSAALPKVPQWVGTQGLTLSVTVSFTLQPDGVVSSVTLEQSSGYADVDSAMLDAIRRWRFTASRGAAAARGLIPYVIKAR